MKRNSKQDNDLEQAAKAALFTNLFSSIAEEMGRSLARTAYSSNIKEREDFSCALFDPDGNLIAQAAHIPVHLGAMPASVRAALEAFGSIDNGDVVMLNDPYRGGTHLPDITLVSAFYINPSDKKPLAYLATRAHHADIGGITPGSMPLATEIYQEGLRIPPVKLYETGKENRAVFEIVAANSRTPEERLGDLRAQVAAHRTGERRLQEAFEKYGKRELLSQMNVLLDHGERLMASVIAMIPDGEYRFKDALDNDGKTENPVTIKVLVKIKGSRATVDFEGTDSQVATGLNAVASITVSAVYYCFLCLLSTSSDLTKGLMDPPTNAGCFRPITVCCPEGSLVNAKPPAAVAGGNVETSQRIVDVVFGALAKALPDVVPAASQGTMNNLSLGGVHPLDGKPFAYYETVAGGMGAGPFGNGMSGVHTHMTNTKNTPVEALEFAYPLRVEKVKLAKGTGGAGFHTGGDGVERDVKLLVDAKGVILSERRELVPYGLAGGESGKAGKNSLVHNGRVKKIPGKCELDLKAGDVIRMRTPGGGGYGKSVSPKRK